MKYLTYKCFVILVAALFAISCKKFVEIAPPSSQLVGETVFSSDKTAIAAVTGIYSYMMQSTVSIISGEMTAQLGVTADEMRNYSTNELNLASYTNSYTSKTDYRYWFHFYSVIYQCNAAISGIEKNGGLTPAISQQLLGEAKFLRAFSYFYLVNLYGRVPLITEPDFRDNINASRAEVAVVYQQIIRDLLDAQNRLSKNFLDANLLSTTTERIRPTYWAATALLARVYLYTSSWAQAEAAATIVIDNKTAIDTVEVDEVFTKNSKEVIFQLSPVVTSNKAVGDAIRFVLVSAPGGPLNPFALSTQLSGAFENGDKRKTNWVANKTFNGVTYEYPFKYKSNNFSLAASNPEYLTVLRVAEQYLIRAEARAMQVNISGAQADLNLIRRRAGLPPTAAASETQLQDAVIQERRVELFTELGHRWFDLKRTARINSVMSVVTPLKGGTWQPYKQLLPIPASELLNDTNLDQNNGY